jgi:hypothetical protein
MGFLKRLFENPTSENVRMFVDRASELGLRAEDRTNAIEMLDQNEWPLAFDIVVAQMFEYDIKIDRDFLQLAHEIGDEMKIDRREYAFLEKLVKKD